MPSTIKERNGRRALRVWLLLAGGVSLATLGGCVSVPSGGDTSVFAQGHRGRSAAVVLPGEAIAARLNDDDGALSEAESWAMTSRRDDALGVPGPHRASGVWPHLDSASLLYPRRVTFTHGPRSITVFDNPHTHRRSGYGWRHGNLWRPGSHGHGHRRGRVY